MVGQAGAELSFRSHCPTRRVPFQVPCRSCAPWRRLCISPRAWGGLGGAFALEKAVLLSLPDGRTPMRAWDLAIDSKRHCEADVQRALAFLLCSRSSKQTLLLYWWIFCQRRLCFHAQRVLLRCAAVGSHVSSCRLARCPRSAERLLAASDLLPPQRDGCKRCGVCRGHMTQPGYSKGFESHCGRDEGGNSPSKDTRGCQEQSVRGCGRCRALAST